MKNFIKKVLASVQTKRVQKAKIQRQLNNRIQRDLIIKGLEDKGI